MKRILLLILLLMPSVAQATVTASTSRIKASCNGSTTAFPFTFNAVDTSEIEVIKTVDDVDTALTVGTEYTTACTNDDCSAGGTVTVVDTCETGSYITILRDVDVTQESDYTEGMPALYETFESDLDKQIRINQEQQEQISRAFLVRKSDNTTDIKVERVSGGYLRWDSLGTDIESASVVNDSGSFLQAGTGAVSRTVSGKIGEFISVTDYDNDLAVAVAAQGGNSVTLLIPGATTIADGVTVTIPSTMTLWFTDGGMVQGTAGGLTETLVVNGGIDAGLTQIFGSDLTVDGVYSGFPEWTGAVGDGVTIDTTAMTKAFNSFSVVELTRNSYAIDAVIQVTSSCIVFSKNQSEIKQTTADTGAIEFLASNTSIQGVKVTGTQNSTWVDGVVGIQFNGDPTAGGQAAGDQLSDVSVIDCEVSVFADKGIDFIFCDNVLASHNNVHDIVKVGIRHQSCNNIITIFNHIENILPGETTSLNAYGITYTHTSTGYDTDPNAGTPQANHPFCNDILCTNNTVINIPSWQGIDTHGFYNFVCTDNKIYGCYMGISATSGSGPAQEYGGDTAVVSNNLITARLPDLTLPSDVWGTGPIYALTLQGGSIQPNRNLTITGNIIRGHGRKDNNARQVIRLDRYINNIVIDSNIIEDWNGVAIGGSLEIIGLTVSNNIFGNLRDATDTIGKCVYIGGATTEKVKVLGNSINATTIPPHTGLGMAADVTKRIGISRNDFSGVDVAEYSVTDDLTYGDDTDYRVNIDAITGAFDLDLTSATYDLLENSDMINVVFSGLTGDVTLNTITAWAGCKIRLINLDATYSVTVTRTSAVLDGGVNQVLGQYDIISLNRMSGSTLFLQNTALMSNS